MGKRYGWAPNHGDKMCSYVFTKGDELIFQNKICYARGDWLNAIYVDDIDTHQLKGISTIDPIVHDLNELAYQGEHHQTQVFYPHEHDILDLKVDITTTSWNGKDPKRKRKINKRVNEEDYCVEL